MIITERLLKQAISSNGSYSYKQMKLMGLSVPPKKGWQKKLVGLEITLEAAAELVGLKDKHLGKKMEFKSHKDIIRELESTVVRLNEEIQALTEENNTLRALNSLR